MIDREELTRKISNLVRKIKEDKRFFGVTIATVIILILVGVGSITGNFISKSSDIENELSLTNLELETCQNNLEECNNTITNLSGQISALEENLSRITENLNNYKSEKEVCEASLDNCTKTKNSLSAELNTSKYKLKEKTKDYRELSQHYDKLSEDYEKIGENFAENKCCPFYRDDYTHYTITEDNNVICCYESGGLYICGFGPDTEEFSEDKVNKLIC